MLYKRWPFLLIILILVFLLVFPGAVFAEDILPKYKASYTISIDAPEQAEAGQAVTLVAQVVENEYNEPVVGAQVDFLIGSDFFIKDLVLIGRAATDAQGYAKIEYVPDTSEVLQVVASYKAGSDFEPVTAERTINVTGDGQPIYHAQLGIQFPNSFYIWMAAIAILIIGIWGTFLYVLTQIFFISIRARSKIFIIILMGIVAVLAIVLVWLLVTPEPQYHYGLLP